MYICMYIFCSDSSREEGAGRGRVHGDGVREGDVGEDGNGGGGGEDDVDGKVSDGDDQEISEAEEEGPGEEGEEEIDEAVSRRINEDEGIGLII